MKRFPAAVAVAVLQTASIAWAQERSHLSLGADAAFVVDDAVGADVAVRYVGPRSREGLLVDVAFPELGPIVRPMLTAELALRLEEDLRVWLGVAVGPSFWPANASDVGLAGLVTLDVAVPLARRVALDFIVRAGGDEDLSFPSDRPRAIGQFALGATFDL